MLTPRHIPALLALLGCSSLAPACTEDGTEIMISIASDMRIPLELDAMRIQITHVARRVTHDYALDPSKPNRAKLPATLGLVGGAYSNQPVFIAVTGYKGDDAIVERQARLPWVKGRILLLRMNLLRTCALMSPPCPKGKTCTEDGCKAPDVDPETLPDFSAELAHAGLDVTWPEAGLDAAVDGKPKDAGADKPLDAPGKEGGADGPVKPDALKPDTLKPDMPPPPKPGTWVTIKAGTFMMGSPAGAPCRVGGGIDKQHKVTLTRSFEMYNTEVTQAEFLALMSYNPSQFQTPACPSCPVEMLTWSEAMAYCNALSVTNGKTPCYACSGSQANTSCGVATAYAGNKFYTCPGYRLPTEAEWEYAYRAGTSTSFYNGMATSCTGADPKLGAIAWYDANANSKTHPAGSKTPNTLGLYDMSGNVAEFTQDYRQDALGTAAVTDPLITTPNTRVMIRGGYFDSQTSWCSAAARSWALAGTGATNRSFAQGFRCVITK